MNYSYRGITYSFDYYARNFNSLSACYKSTILCYNIYRNLIFFILASTLFALPTLSNSGRPLARVARRSRQFFQERPPTARITCNDFQRSAINTVSQKVATHHSFVSSPSLSSISPRMHFQLIEPVRQSRYTMQQGFSFSQPPALERVNLEHIVKQRSPLLRQETRYALNILENEPAKVIPQLQPNEKHVTPTPTPSHSFSQSKELRKIQNPSRVVEPLPDLVNPTLVPVTNAHENFGQEHKITLNQNIEKSQETNLIVYSNKVPSAKDSIRSKRNFIQENIDGVSANAKKTPSKSRSPRKTNAKILKSDNRKRDQEYFAENSKNLKPHALKPHTSVRRPGN
ncbi:hypothetical protein ROZALSC1DRAFT_20952 [Rozella allomycis CSF55]|uniref:Uncharacterized protein n=1 Tax=Rozella allomycis (strain CSF55) TaxID=988480 RepID=A0A4P9YN60_ROZAC|nr:hypothetical protein ROZALSC1DRAFT_20952 [Rozella allomycis CSF55]